MNELSPLGFVGRGKLLLVEVVKRRITVPRLVGIASADEWIGIEQAGVQYPGNASITDKLVVEVVSTLRKRAPVHYIQIYLNPDLP